MKDAINVDGFLAQVNEILSTVAGLVKHFHDPKTGEKQREIAEAILLTRLLPLVQEWQQKLESAQTLTHAGKANSAGAHLRELREAVIYATQKLHELEAELIRP